MVTWSNFSGLPGPEVTPGILERGIVMLRLSRLVLLSSAVVARGALAQSTDSIRSLLRTVDIQSGRIETVFSADRHFEAPNWSPDGRYFVVNSKGRLYRVPADGDKRLEEIPTGFAT